MLSGSIVALVTPMADDGSLDLVALAALIEFQIAAGSNGLVIAGSTGEACALSLADLRQLLVFVVKHVRQRIAVIVGVGTNNTITTIARAQLAQRLGANGLLVVTPYYNKPTQQGLYQHYLALAQAVSLPVYLYNVPSRTACDLLPQTVARLAGICDNILGLKEATANIGRQQELITLKLPDNFVLLSGDDLSAAEFILAGAHGVISVIANIVPAKIASLVIAAKHQDSIKTKLLDQELIKLNKLLFCQTNPIVVKWALYLMGLIGPGIRLPLLPLEAKFRPDLIAVLASLKLISSNSKEYL